MTALGLRKGRPLFRGRSRIQRQSSCLALHGRKLWVHSSHTERWRVDHLESIAGNTLTLGPNRVYARATDLMAKPLGSPLRLQQHRLIPMRTSPLALGLLELSRKQPRLPLLIIPSSDGIDKLASAYVKPP
uniref:Uncharacterized protein n=1 Tax=Vitis vinifera TaxID=29760 RepID=A5BF37_VITVI|nr:hypothetical protein VITISV_014271 [Vitis vinifera]